MAMELSASPYPQDPFGYNFDQVFGMLNNNITMDDDSTQGGGFKNWEYYSFPSVVNDVEELWDHTSNSSTDIGGGGNVKSRSTTSVVPVEESTTGGGGGGGEGGGGGGNRRKRRRTKNTKNKEEMENQRMTHIAVERNRRKQMNEYLGVLRSLMPSSYAERGDQASIVGGAINFVKELEQLLQSMEAKKRTSNHYTTTQHQPFSNFFFFPQFSTSSTNGNVADIEVSVVETHANVKILTAKQPKQLLNLLAAFQNLSFTVLHLNLTTLDQMVLYSISLKIEEGCQVSSVEDIASTINQILRRIQVEKASFS